jgi:phosphatidylglycerol:prolipoprotein diacylglycerol transferase
LALGAMCGGMIGAKLPFVLSDWPGFLSGQAWFQDGKTIMSGLVGGYLGAMLTEWALGIQGFSCDVLAAPLAAAIGVGRLACFQAGCCYGTATSLPWGVDFGDGCRRHPTQLYESAFHLTAAAVLFQLQRRQMFRGQLIRLYFVAYFVYRFSTEFIRPEPRIFFRLTGYQMAALVRGSCGPGKTRRGSIATRRPGTIC